MKSLFSVDVEDWYHILDIPGAPLISEWAGLPSRVEKNFRRLLDILNAKQVKVTCFFLGWIAERYPRLVTEAHDRGHEIASHGYSHRLVYEMTPQEFFEDASRSKAIIENIISDPVIGFRAPGFSVTEATPWFFEMLVRAGYRYDSSVFPAKRGHGGMESDNLSPYRIRELSNEFIEFPLTIAKAFGRRVSFFGGGYLRLFPYRVIKRMAGMVFKENRPVIWYVHPREIDPDHPRLPMSFIRRFKSYCNLKSTEAKIIKLLGDFEWMRFSDYISLDTELREMR
jgi:polysaccharide deacetylase family protein (PEP-CTERM system associated)